MDVVQGGIGHHRHHHLDIGITSALTIIDGRCLRRTMTIFLPILVVVLADRGGRVPLPAIAMVGADEASLIIVVTLVIIRMIRLHSSVVGIVGRLRGGCPFHLLLPMRSLAVLLLLAIGRGAIPGTTAIATVAPTTATHGQIAGFGKPSLPTAAPNLAIVVVVGLILILLGSRRKGNGTVDVGIGNVGMAVIVVHGMGSPLLLLVVPATATATAIAGIAATTARGGRWRGGHHRGTCGT